MTIVLHVYVEFKNAGREARQTLYLDLAKHVWSPTLIQAVMETTL